MIHLERHLQQLEATIADIRAHLHGKTLVEQGLTADDPDTPQVETEAVEAAGPDPVDAAAQGA